MASSVTPEGYVYGSTPTPNAPFWDNSMNFSDITATADIDNTAGEPSVDLEVTKNNVGVGNLEFHFHGLKGQSGGSGKIEADATVDANTGTPSVTVEKTYIDEETTKFTFNFKNLKGENGQDGAPGTPGTNGADGTDGITPVISATATVDNTSSDTPTCTVTKSGTDAAPSFEFAFHGIKGASGGGGGGSFDLSNIPDLDNYVFSSLNPTKGTADSFDPTTTQIVDTASAIIGESAELYSLQCDEITLNGTFDVSTDGETYSEETLTNLKLYNVNWLGDATITLNTHTTQIPSGSNVAIYHPVSATKGHCSFKQNFLQVNVKNENANAVEVIIDGYDENWENHYYVKCKVKLNYNSFNIPKRTTAFGGVGVVEFTIGQSNQTGSIILETPNLYLLDKNNSNTAFPYNGYCNIEVPVTFSLSKRPVTTSYKPNVTPISARTNITNEEIYTHFATKYGVTFPS